jgi:hypothetical protein
MGSLSIETAAHLKSVGLDSRAARGRDANFSWSTFIVGASYSRTIQKLFIVGPSLNFLLFTST